MRNYLWVWLIIMGINSPLSAQDSVMVLGLEDVYRNILEYHPVARQADLLVSSGEWKIRKARGAFDPYLFGYLDEKQFDKKEYYRLLNTGMKIPTWFGAEVKAGYDQAGGVFLNPENSLPDNGLVYAGVEVPIGQGLFIDERRKTLKQAKIYAEATETQKIQILNDLLYEASVQYWEWVNAWNQMQVVASAIDVSRANLDAVRQSFEVGDKPAIDTLEALIQLQSLEVAYNQTRINYRNHTLGLSGFLWYDNSTPLEITDLLQPPSFEVVSTDFTFSEDSVEYLLANLPAGHPEMRLYDYKIADLEIEKRWLKEQLKPEVNIKYQFLTESVGNDFMNNFSTENYKWGLSVSFPVFLRKQRSNLQLLNIKLQETSLDQSQKLLILQNKVENYAFQINNYSSQIEQFSLTVENYRTMLAAELRKFEIGESTLFLINSRQNKLLDAQIKLIELNAKYQKSRVSMAWSLGILPES